MTIRPPAPRTDNLPYAPLTDGSGNAVLRVGDINGVRTVVHGSDPNVARPAIGTGTVRWVGTVMPAAMTSTDLWVQTIDPATINPVTILSWAGAWYADTLVTAGKVDGDTISSWTDATGGTKHLTPNGPLATGNALLKTAPTGYNGQPAVKFASSPLASPTFSALAQPNTVVVVASAGGSTEGVVADVNGGFGGSLYRVSSPNEWKWTAAGGAPPVAFSGLDTSPHLFILTASNTSTVGNLRIDGVDNKAATGGGTRTQFRLGLFDNTQSSQLLSGHVAFAAYVAGALTTSQIATIETWARAKYGITI